MRRLSPDEQTESALAPEGGFNGAPQRRLIGISLLPSAATLGNLLCGFFAIAACLLSIRHQYFPAPQRTVHPWLAEFFPTYVAAGAYLIVGAMLFDALDGRLARLARRTTEFGAQLDSIADIVSFGTAPALLFVTILLPLADPADGKPLIHKLQGRFSIVCVLIYVSCAAIRLARYNAENIKSESAAKNFAGLPVPGAAAGFVALLILHEDVVANGGETLAVWASVIRWCAAPVALGLGMLMISRVDYVHVFNVYVRRKHPPIHLIWLLLLLGIGWLLSIQVLLVVLAFTYVLSGLLMQLRHSAAARATITASGAGAKSNRVGARSGVADDGL